MAYTCIREEELKNRVATDYFADYDTDSVVGNIDFALAPKGGGLFGDQYLLWAEAKRGQCDLCAAFAQLVLTIGKARTFNKHLPPPFLAAFDNEKIAFVPYSEINDVFYQTDFNWNVAPSDHETREFRQIYDLTKTIIERNLWLYYYDRNDAELRFFIKNNIGSLGAGTSKIQIDKNNFTIIYHRWLDEVKPYIDFNWAEGRKENILDCDFYRADLFVDDERGDTMDTDETILKQMLVIFRHSQYEIPKENLPRVFPLFNAYISFKEGGREVYTQFWKKYKRPPINVFQGYILNRRDLLIPQDVREHKGEFFTPKIWVEKSQKYLADVFGANWQDEYYIWDCAAGVGNLLVGLRNEYNVWASTLNMGDVATMYERISNGARLLKSHVFQFDFLNDDFSKLPQGLQDIINDPEKRKKLIIYINPPYAEIAGNKIGVNLSKVHDKYAKQLAGAGRELFAQFLVRIYNEIQGCKIGEFSTLKTISGSNFKTFREYFRATLKKCFIVPATTFDNVYGQFPIGFKVWDTDVKTEIKSVCADVFDAQGNNLGKHSFYSYENAKYISKWVLSFKIKGGKRLGWIEGVTRNDFQSQNGICILNKKEQIAVPRGIEIYDENLPAISVCFAVRKCIPATWLNDRDQFLYPSDRHKTDVEFQNDCLIYTLFADGNNIQSRYGTNHWIPFTEKEVGAKDNFASHFMSDLLKARSIVFAGATQAVFVAGRDLWRYYHAKIHNDTEGNINASYYDIREYFCGRRANGILKSKSDTDERYNELIDALRAAVKLLARKIEPKVYEYGFLKE